MHDAHQGGECLISRQWMFGVQSCVLCWLSCLRGMFLGNLTAQVEVERLADRSLYWACLLKKSRKSPSFFYHLLGCFFIFKYCVTVYQITCGNQKAATKTLQR